MKLRLSLFPTIILAALAGCTGPDRSADRFATVNGPLPVLSDYGAGEASAAKSAAENETRLFEAFYVRAGYGQSSKPGLKDDGWYNVTLAGINAVDEQCERYLDALFWVRRDLETAKNQVNLVGATTATLLGLFNAAAEAVAATAAGFGLATQGIANASEGILFTVEPSAIRKIVERAQAQYRNAVENQPERYQSRPAAFSAIQGYLALCLPASIEAQVNDSVSHTDFRVTRDSTGTKPALARVATTEDRITAGDSQQDVVRFRELARSPVPPMPPTASAPANCRGDECALSMSQAKAIQDALCLSGSGIDANFGAATRAEISDFEGAIDPDLVTRRDGELSAREAAYLIEVGSCAGTPFLSAFERFSLGSSASSFRGTIPENFKALLDLLALRDSSFDAAAHTGFDDAVRAAIRKAQEDEGMSPVDGRLTRALSDRLRPI